MEIDALLEHMASVPEPLSGGQSSPLLADFEPVEDEGAGRGSDRQHRLYDFRRPEKLSKDQIRTLRGHFGLFSRKAANYLANLSHSSVEVTLVEIDQTNYRGIFTGHGVPMVMCAFSIGGDHGQGMLKLNLSQVFGLVDRLMGGSGQAGVRPRPLTEFERSLCGEVFGQLLTFYSETRGRKAEAEPIRVDLIETDERLMPRSLPGDEVMVRGIYDVRLGQQSGYLNLYLPLRALTEVLGAKGGAGSARAALEGAEIPPVIGKLPLEVIVLLGTSRMRASEVAALTPGAIVPLEQEEARDLEVRVGGVPRFRARAGLRGPRLAVQIMGRWEDRNE
ncbi:MAG: FliM/FliN family flagellar motor switch protein [Candidatus Eremiobacterota bacterium]